MFRMLLVSLCSLYSFTSAFGADWVWGERVSEDIVQLEIGLPDGRQITTSSFAGEFATIQAPGRAWAYGIAAIPSPDGAAADLHVFELSARPDGREGARFRERFRAARGEEYSIDELTVQFASAQPFAKKSQTPSGPELESKVADFLIGLTIIMPDGREVQAKSLAGDYVTLSAPDAGWSYGVAGLPEPGGFSVTLHIIKTSGEQGRTPLQTVQVDLQEETEIGPFTVRLSSIARLMTSPSGKPIVEGLGTYLKNTPGAVVPDKAKCCVTCDYDDWGPLTVCSGCTVDGDCGKCCIGVCCL